MINNIKHENDFFILEVLQKIIHQYVEPEMGKGRDGTEKLVPVPGQILNFGPRPFSSRDEPLILCPRPSRPGTLRICVPSPSLIKKLKINFLQF